MPDGVITSKIGEYIKRHRLRQGFTQTVLADEAQVSYSTVRAIEGGRIGNFDSLLRVMRVLGVLDVFVPLTKDDELSPTEYLKLVGSLNGNRRKRGFRKDKRGNSKKENSEW